MSIKMMADGTVNQDEGGNDVNPEVTSLEYSDSAQPSISQRNIAARSSRQRLRLAVEGPHCPVQKAQPETPHPKTLNSKLFNSKH